MEVDIDFIGLAFCEHEGKEICVHVRRNGTGIVKAVNDGYIHTEEGARIKWKELLPFEQYEIDFQR